MTVRLLNPRLRAVAAAALPLAALLAAAPSQAQYKIVGSDGKVTYSDRMPSSSEARVSALGARSALTAPAVELPFELRKVASRYPVTLYVSTGACEPCDAGRNLLKQRGIPYAEKQVQSAEDSEALEKLSGGRDAPTLTIGTQVVRGVSADLWNSYLDAAGYPRESKLPSSYQYKAPSPIVERREASAASRPDAQPVPPLQSTVPEQAQTPGGIRF